MIFCNSLVRRVQAELNGAREADILALTIGELIKEVDSKHSAMREPSVYHNIKMLKQVTGVFKMGCGLDASMRPVGPAESWQAIRDEMMAEVEEQAFIPYLEHRLNSDRWKHNDAEPESLPTAMARHESAWDDYTKETNPCEQPHKQKTVARLQMFINWLPFEIQGAVRKIFGDGQTHSAGRTVEKFFMITVAQEYAEKWRGADVKAIIEGQPQVPLSMGRRKGGPRIQMLGTPFDPAGPIVPIEAQHRQVATGAAMQSDYEQGTDQLSQYGIPWEIMGPSAHAMGNYQQQPNYQYNKATVRTPCKFCEHLKFRNADTHRTAQCNKPGNPLSDLPLVTRIINSNYEIMRLLCTTGTEATTGMELFLKKVKAWSRPSVSINESGQKTGDIQVTVTNDAIHAFMDIIQKFGHYPACKNPHCAIKDPELENNRRLLNRLLLYHDPSKDSVDRRCAAWSFNHQVLNALTNGESAEQTKINLFHEDSAEIEFETDM